MNLMEKNMTIFHREWFADVIWDSLIYFYFFTSSLGINEGEQVKMRNEKISLYHEK